MVSPFQQFGHHVGQRFGVAPAAPAQRLHGVDATVSVGVRFAGQELKNQAAVAGFQRVADGCSEYVEG